MPANSRRSCAKRARDGDGPVSRRAAGRRPCRARGVRVRPLNRWAVVGSAWLIAAAALITWLRTTPSSALREQLAVLQFWSLEICVFLGLALTFAVAADLRRAIQWRDALAMPFAAALALGLTLLVAPR